MGKLESRTAERLTSNAQRPTSERRSQIIQTEKFARRAGESVALFLSRKVLHRFDEFAGMCFAERERIIRTERDTLRAEKLEQQLQRIGIVD